MAIKNNQIEVSPKVLDAVVTAPVTGPGKGSFYSKLVSAVTEGFYIDSLGQEIQITQNGILLSSGETNDGTNVGATGASVFKGKTGLNLEFRKLVAGANTTITENANEIVIASTGGGSGEVNTASNVGGGQILFKQKTGVNLEFKTLVAGTNITLTPGVDTITISAAGGGGGGVSGGANVGTAGVGVFKANNAGTLEFKKLLAGNSNITISATVNDEVSISAVGDINAAANLSTAGAGKAEVWSTKTGNTLNFKRLVAGTNVTLAQDANTITINSSGGGGGSGMETNYLTFDSGNIIILATGLPADLANITATKDFGTANTCILNLNFPSGVRYQSVVVNFTSSETTGRTICQVKVPEPSGSTSILTSIRPIAFKLNTVRGVTASGGIVNNSSATITIEHSSNSAGQDYGMMVLF
jgi:hypothetical protein